jgi:hypothetical protein
VNNDTLSRVSMSTPSPPLTTLDFTNEALVEICP